MTLGDVTVEVLGDDQVDVEIAETQVAIEVAEDPTLVEVSTVGLQGPRGSGFSAGVGAPLNSTGIVGDYYLDTYTGEFYGPKGVEGWPPPAATFTQITRRAVYEQTTASSEWTVDHDLGGQPQVTVVDSAGTQVVGEVRYVSESRVVVEFSAPFSGFAYLT